MTWPMCGFNLTITQLSVTAISEGFLVPYVFICLSERFLSREPRSQHYHRYLCPSKLSTIHIVV